MRLLRTIVVKNDGPGIVYFNPITNEARALEPGNSLTVTEINYHREELEMETQTEATTEITTTLPTETETKSNFGFYALIANKDDGEVKTLFAKAKKDIAKLLAEHGPSWQILGAFKGKQLNIEQKVSFSLN